MIGLDSKLYLDAAGAGVGTWTELDIVGDVNVSLSHNEATRKNRASVWEKVSLGQKMAEISFDMTRDPSNAGYVSLRTAWIDRSDIGVAAMSEAILTIGSEGLQADCKVVGFDVNEGLEEDETVSVTLKPSADSATEPSYAIITV